MCSALGFSKYLDNVLTVKARSGLHTQTKNIKCSCECGAFKVESFPCGCMGIVADKAGSSVLPMLHMTDTNEFLKRVYTDLPACHNPAPSSRLLLPAHRYKQTNRKNLVTRETNGKRVPSILLPALLTKPGIRMRKPRRTGMSVA